VRGLIASRLPISLLVRPSTSSAAISRSRAVNSTFSLRRDDRSSKAQMPAACGCAGSSARPETWHQNSSAGRPSAGRRFITRSSAYQPLVFRLAAMRAPVRSNSSCVGYSSSKLWPMSASRVAPNISCTWRLQSTISRLRDSTSPMGARSNAVR